jgi:hypothetical protein
MISKIFVLGAALLLAADAEPRVWTDKHGEKIAEASLGGVEDGSVRLLTADGETLAVALDVLSDGDRAFIAANTPRDWDFKDGLTITGTLVKKSGVQLHLKDEQGQTHVVAFDSLVPADRRLAEEQLRKLRLANPRFIRVVRNSRGEPIALETSIARYTGKNADGEKITVDLVSAVHVGDRSYFEKLNEEFKQYDVVLYELVAPKDDAVPMPGRRSRNAVGDIQRVIKDLLGFDYQLDAIDYAVESFLHADMTPEELAAEMRKRGETPLTMFLRMFENLQKAPVAESEPLTEEDLVLALFRFARNPSLTMRRAMAGQMEDVEGFVEVFEGPGGSAILTGRNDAALKVLREQIDEGRSNIAVFYGAGHMPDLEKKLQQDFGLKLEDERWLQAWEMREGAAPKELEE